VCTARKPEGAHRGAFAFSGIEFPLTALPVESFRPIWQSDKNTPMGVDRRIQAPGPKRPFSK
jgi:hypothetical protein